jgi:integrase
LPNRYGRIPKFPSRRAGEKLPTILKLTKTIYLDGRGKRCARDTTGARKYRRKTTKWYAQGIPGHPPKKRFPLTADKRVAERMLADLVSNAERGIHDMPDRGAARTKLLALVEDFKQDMTVGMASKVRGRSRLPSEAQVDLNAQRVETILQECKFVTAADLNTKAPRTFARFLIGKTNTPRKDGGWSHQTAEFYRKSGKRFIWWLSFRKRLPVRPDLFDDVVSFNPKDNRVHVRRPATPEEVARLLLTARQSAEDWRHLYGEDRYHVYLLAFSTGFRASELSRLLRSSFDLDAIPPAVVLPAKQTKNKKPVRQVLPAGVADQFRTYLERRPPEGPLWPGTWRQQPVKMLRFDLERAEIPYRVETAEGPRFLDFHALRHTFVSMLATAKVGVKELQILARHADPTLTLAVYTHVGVDQLADSIAKLPQLEGGISQTAVSTMARDDLEKTAIFYAAVVTFLLAPPDAPTAVK